MKLLKLSVLALIMLATTSTELFAQASEGNVLINAYSGGLVRKSTNNTTEATTVDFLLGLETNFFIEDQFSFTIGYDHYFINGGGNTPSIGIGSRIYPTEYFFLRYKTNLNTSFNGVNDFMLGGGYDFYMNDSFFTEVNLDYHLINRGFGVRFGIGLLL